MLRAIVGPASYFSPHVALLSARFQLPGQSTGHANAVDGILKNRQGKEPSA